MILASSGKFSLIFPMTNSGLVRKRLAELRPGPYSARSTRASPGLQSFAFHRNGQVLPAYATGQPPRSTGRGEDSNVNQCTVGVRAGLASYGAKKLFSFMNTKSIPIDYKMSIHYINDRYLVMQQLGIG